MTIRLITGDALEQVQLLQTESIQCCITSPPYYGLRNYLVDGQIGLEQSPQEYIDKLVAVFREVKRVLKKDGLLWVVIGDSYCGYHGNSKVSDDEAPSNKNGYIENMRQSTVGINNLKAKDLIGIPWSLAFALRDDGWYLRSDIIWSKPNPMPSSVTDRCTTSHEYIFMFSKSSRYYYDADAIAEPSVNSNKVVSLGEKSFSKGQSNGANRPKSGNALKDIYTVQETRNKRSVWTINTQPYPEAHFATYPPKLIEPMILASTKEGDTILDPFSGAGTTVMVAAKYFRNAIGIDLNPEYNRIAYNRIMQELPMFAEFI